MKTWAERTQGRPGFADVWRTAMAIRDARAQREQNQWQFDKAKESYDRQQDFNTLLTGPNPEEARIADPIAYERWNQAQNAAKVEAQKNALEMRKTESGIAKDQREIADKRLAATQTAQQFMTSALQANPAAIGTVRQRRDDLVRQGLIDHFNLPGEDSAVDTDPKTGQPIQTWVQSEPTQKQIEVGQRMAGAEDPYAKPSADMIDYRAGQQDPEFRAYEMEKARRKAPTTNINVGGTGVGASLKTRTDQEAALLRAQDTSAMLDQIESTARGPDGKVNFGQFLGWGPRAKQASLDMLANIDPQSIPPDQREWFDRANDFRATVTAYKANEYHELFGGSQTATEIKNGASSILSEKMSEPAFNAAYRRLRQKTDRAMKVASMVLAENIPVGTPEYRKRFAELEQQRFGRSEWQGAGGDSGITREQQISKRMAEMRGVAPEVQIQNLKNEGLFTEQQAAEALQHIGGR